MALLSSLPEAPPPAPAPREQRAAAPAWVRTALFGTPRDLTALLDRGLDPNSRTEQGTSLLMMAAPDADKVRVLVARRADVKNRSRSGSDALTVASTYYGNSESIRLLLEAGAEADAPEDVRGRRSALAFASMSGDVETVKLLLDHRAEASVEALSEAVTFGHADVVQRLVDAGVNVRLTEGTGINLLHWATITNRPGVIPILAKAGVPIDATDDFGFTPLMYAATIDVGDTATLDALLAAGASRRVRNADGRTPIEQARRLKHTQLADRLR